MTTPELIQCCHYRWFWPILGELAALGGGAKFVTLLFRLGISRDSLSRSLVALVNFGYIAHNTVHAHPLRPEYLLTDSGKRLSATANHLVLHTQQLESGHRLFHKWSLPVLWQLDHHRARTTELLALPGANPRAISLAQQDVLALGLVVRQHDWVVTPLGREYTQILSEVMTEV
jgi:DNA-binding HxlR family transcriptional regulator